MGKGRLIGSHVQYQVFSSGMRGSSIDSIVNWFISMPARVLPYLICISECPAIVRGQGSEPSPLGSRHQFQSRQATFRSCKLEVVSHPAETMRAPMSVCGIGQPTRLTHLTYERLGVGRFEGIKESVRAGARRVYISRPDGKNHKECFCYISRKQITTFFLLHELP